MGFSCGIVGLPNVGKSTLFNALTKSKVESSNYPFCTIDANIGVVALPDNRLYEIAQYVKPKSVIPTYMNFTDIAGLIKGASEGQGLGNQFLAHIKDVEAIAQIVRLFDDPDIVHIDKVDPIRDIEIILTELRLKDLDTLNNRKVRLNKNRKVGKKEADKEIRLVEKLEELINNEKTTNNMLFTDSEKGFLKEYRLLSLKPMIIVANLGEDQISSVNSYSFYDKLLSYTKDKNFELISLSAKIEEELTSLTNSEAKEYLEDMGIDESGLKQLINKGYSLLGLISFFTAGEKECRGWTIKKGTSASKAAGKIHSDFEKGFIRAEVIGYDDFINAKGSYNNARQNGKLRIEGKDYIIKDGDIVHFRFNV